MVCQKQQLGEIRRNRTNARLLYTSTGRIDQLNTIKQSEICADCVLRRSTSNSQKAYTELSVSGLCLDVELRSCDYAQNARSK